MDRSAEIFPRQLRHLRQERGFSQERLAELASLSINAISSFERGLRFPRPSSLDALAVALGAEPGDFMVDHGSPTGNRGPLAELEALLRRATPETVELILDLAKSVVSHDRRHARAHAAERNGTATPKAQVASTEVHVAHPQNGSSGASSADAQATQ